MPAVIADMTSAEPRTFVERASSPRSAANAVGGDEKPDRAAMMDQAIVAAARNGNRAAFARVYEHFAPMVHGILLARVPRHEAEDLTQEVFLHAMRMLKSLNDDAAIGPWLATTARNLAVSFHRKRRPLNALDQSAEPEARIPAMGQDNSEALAALATIQTLPESYAEVLVLRLVEGLTGPQIAACTGLTHGSVRVTLHRGMNILRDALKRSRDGEVRS